MATFQMPCHTGRVSVAAVYACTDDVTASVNLIRHDRRCLSLADARSHVLHDIEEAEKIVFATELEAMRR
jgi:hypothetical protein